jgi:hypothetical protein
VFRYTQSIVNSKLICFIISKQLELIVYTIATHDFPGKWNTILPSIINKLKNSQSFFEIYACLLALKNLVEIYEHLVNEDREPLELLVPNIFPLLETYCKSLLIEYNEQAAWATQAILKTFYATIHVH